MSDYRLQIRNGDGTYRGEIGEFIGFSGGTVRVNDVGTAQLTLDANSPTVADLLSELSEVLVVREADERILFGGPVQENALVRNADENTVTLTIHEETQWLNWRVCHPYADDPDLGTSQDDIRAVWSRTGTLISTCLYDLVDVSVGPSAAARRRVPTFALAADPAVGPIVSPFQVGYGTGLVFPVIQQQAARYGLWAAMIDGEFTIRAGVDRSASVVFEMEQVELRDEIVEQTHSLAGFDYRVAVPAANAAFTVSNVDVSNVFRTYVEILDDDSIARWGWIEAFDNESGIDRTDPVGLAEAGASFLEGQQGSESLNMTVIEGPVYGDDYELGDLVTARLTDDLSYVGRVTQIGITGDRDGWRIAPALGERVLLRKARHLVKLADLDTRITRLEGP